MIRALCGGTGMLHYCHGDRLGLKLVAQVSSRLRIQVLGHGGHLAEVALGLCMLAFDLTDERCLICLNTHTEEGEVWEQLTQGLHQEVL